jgi:hypothetical protein
MAYITGTASDHINLWDTLLDFLQNNTDLVAAGQNWSVAWQHPDYATTTQQLVLEGPGLSGADKVLVGLWRRDYLWQTDESVIALNGMTGIIPTATSWGEHVNVLGYTPYMFLDTNPMQYWMVANGRRFVVVVRISTVYLAMYGGLYMPYATPQAYPYPLFIGGSRGYNGYSSSYAPTSWRDNEKSGYRHFVYPLSDGGNNSWYNSPALMLGPDGEWREGSINASSTYNLPRFTVGPRNWSPYLSADWCESSQSGFDFNSNRIMGYNSIRDRLTGGLNGEYSLTPITLHKYSNSSVPSPTTYGILDGVYSVPGDGNVTENIITADGVDHLVLHNVQYTGTSEYWALALE